MKFADIHIHALFGVDDGPKTEQEMHKLIAAAYADGTRVMCLTPHFHPGYFGGTKAKSEKAFSVLKAQATERYPGLKLCLGNELRYSPEAVEWLASGDCRTLNGTDCVLVDFRQDEKQQIIIRGLESLMNGGYIPVLAHAERYSDLSAGALRDLSRNGVWIQLDVQSLFGVYGLGARFRSKGMLKAGLVDIVSTDAHDLRKRSPGLQKGYEYVARKYSHEYADAIFYKNAIRLLQGGSQ